METDPVSAGGGRRPLLREMAAVLRQGLRGGGQPLDRQIDPGRRRCEPLAGGLAVRAGLFHRGVEGGAARGAVRFAGAGADPARLAGAHARPPAFFRHRAGGADRAAGHDVHLLRRAGRRRHAPPVGIQRRRAGLLARQPGTEPGDAGVYGVCARLAVCRYPPGGGRGDGAGHRLAGAARDRPGPAARRAAAAGDDGAERRAAVPRPLGQSAVGAVLVDHPDLRAGGAGAGCSAGLAVPARRRRRRQ